MRAMILAAGRGKRMMPLTDELPKPLLKAGKYTLIEYHLFNLANTGITSVVINLAWLGDKIRSYLGTGEKYGLDITYSDEQEALETAGGIIKALPMLGKEPFLVISADTWTDFSYSQVRPELPPNSLANLYMVNNPVHNELGDFAFSDTTPNFLVLADSGHQDTLTYSGIGIFDPAFFMNLPVSRMALRDLMIEHANKGALAGQLLPAQWADVGTPARLAELDALLVHNS